LNGAEKLIKSKGSSADSKGVGSLGEKGLKTSKTREESGDFSDDGDADFDEESTKIISKNGFDSVRGADDDINEVRGPETLEPNTTSSKGKGSDSRKSKSGSKKSGKGKTSGSYSKKSKRSPPGTSSKQPDGESGVPVPSAPSGAPLYSPSPAGSVSPSPSPIPTLASTPTSSHNRPNCHQAHQKPVESFVK